MNYQIINGHSAEVLKTFPDNHFDSIVTDPPYLIGFLGKEWDAKDNFQLDVYKECLRVLKPGGHILAFSAARTYHHLAVTLEQAGFEIRDQIMWIYSSGFPKSQDVGKSIQRSLGVKEKKTLPKEQQTSTAGFAKNGAQEQSAWSGETTVCTDPEAKQWAGWGTSLKPAHEPIALARKPIKLSIAKNCQQYGVGALNIDACRIESETLTYPANGMNRMTFNQAEPDKWEGETVTNDHGRFPSNVLGDIPDYQKYFYCPKVSRRERHIGFDLNVIPTNPDAMYVKDENGKMGDGYSHRVEAPRTGNSNNHPTVKPIELMKYLIKLVTPQGGIVLDPFNGSGSTGCAAVELGCEYVGIELDPAYVEIAKKRIEAWNKEETTFNELFE
jgi:site-specific DNA-methyltransferase (adenine-specific)